MEDRNIIFDAFRNCITEPKCRDCPWKSCEEFHQTKKIPLDLCLDILKLLKEQEAVVPLTIDDAVGEIMDKHYKRLKEQEIVRCKDCKHWDADEHECNIKTGWFACGADWFCADGERCVNTDE